MKLNSANPNAPQRALPPPSDLLRMHARLREAETLRRAKSLGPAQAICRDLLKDHPDCVGALHTLGLIHADRHEHEAARRTLEAACRLKPDDAAIHATLGEIYRKEREYELAVEAYEKAYSLDSSLHLARFGLALSLVHLGRIEEAGRILNALYRDCGMTASIAVLSGLPKKYVEIDLLGAVNKARADAGQSDDETFAFARGAALDKAGRHEEAWREFTAANARVFALRAGILKRDEERQAKNLALLHAFPAHPPAPHGETPCRSLFILGPSRSGKTTMERLAAELPGLRRGFENPIIENAFRRTF